MDDSKFRAIPETEDFKIPFKLEEKALLNWLGQLTRHYESKQACLQTLRLIQAISKTDLSASKQLLFLKIILGYVKHFVANLENVCWNASFPLSDEERACAEAVIWNYLALAQGFFIVAVNTGKKEDKQLFSLALALHAMGQAQLHIAAVYGQPNEKFWSLVYKIFALAEEKKLLNIEVNDVEIKHSYINTLFKKILIFQLGDNSQFRPQDMRTIFEFLDNVCGDCLIYDTLENKEQKGVFVFDLHSHKPPQPIKNSEKTSTNTTRYFSSIPVANSLYQTLRNANLWSGTLQGINNSLFDRVIKTLGIEHKRKYTRLSDSHSVYGVIGFENIIKFLYHNSSTPMAIALQQVENGTDFSYQQLKLLASHQQLESKNSKQDDEDWIQENSQKQEHEITIIEMAIFDSSAKGYSVCWHDLTAKIRIGDVLGIIGEDKKRLEIAVIRRIAMSSDSYFRFGVEIIGFESETVYISKSNSGNEGVWGIFIAGIKQLKQPDTLIYNASSFNIGDEVCIYKGEGEQTMCQLVAELYTTSAISHVEIDYS